MPVESAYRKEAKTRTSIILVILSMVLTGLLIGQTACAPAIATSPTPAQEGKLIFLHGVGGWSGVFLKQLAYFRDAEALSMPGRPEGTPVKTIGDALTWLNNYIQQKGYKKPVLVGHSFGGGIAMAYDLQYPGQLRGLVVAAGSTRVGLGDPATFQQRAGDMVAYAESLREQFKRLPADEREQLIQKMIAMGSEVRVADWFCASTYDVTATVGIIKTPTLVIRGSEDNPDRAEALAKQIPGSWLVIVNGAGHYLMLDKPEEFNKAIEVFVKSLG